MRMDRFVKFLVLVITVLLGMIALRPYVVPPVIEAQFGDAHPVYIEPGAAMLRASYGSRQVMGKVVIDLRNGNIGGFPTLSPDPDPYPSSGSNTTPPTSHPFLLGKFALADMDK